MKLEFGKMLLFIALAATSVRIPEAVLKARFGPTHTFWLKDKSPNPVFVQGGYKFRADTTGRGLYEPLYYNVPVYVDLDEDYGTKGYRLYTTKETHVSVDVELLGEAKQ